MDAIAWTPVIPVAAQRVWQEILRPIARELRASASTLTDRAVDRMLTELPGLFPDAQAAEESRGSILAHILQLADTLEHASDPRRFALPESGLSLIRSRVRRQVPLSEIMRLYRMAQERVWQWMFAGITTAAHDATELSMAVDLATGWLFAYTDGAMIRAERAYEVEREGWMRSAAAEQSAAIADILAERERDAAQASTRLRYEVNRHHLAVSVWLERAPEGGDAQSLLGGAFAEIARRVGAESTLTHHPGALVLAGWVSSREPFAAESLACLDHSGSPAGVVVRSGLTGGRPDLGANGAASVRVALGVPGHGLGGFRRGHIEAEHARRVAALIGARADTATRYRDIAVAALCTADRVHARDFVTRVLGPLAAPDESTFRLAMTLAVYLEENRSRRRAADRLMVHPNTVSYRVQQAEAILGRTADTDILELQVALAILPAMPGLSALPAPEL
ncbi:helix-turn-helix domain-containing protein [Nocardia sp. SYP-A9097]|uniref:PucR family transcriptional regulator n=1 Tax=Nocardia sp. SYP-A9097 TaxID=2663237 RepID=UPI0028161916|nr:helix-turn-helix domain-containing protein [Nocardia sp. SYP-A9097]